MAHEREVKISLLWNFRLWVCQRKSHYPDLMKKGHSTCHCKISEDSRSGSRFLNQAGSWHGMWLGEALNPPTNLVVWVINDPTSSSPSSISLVYFPFSPDSLFLGIFHPRFLHVLDTGISTCNGLDANAQCKRIILLLTMIWKQRALGTANIFSLAHWLRLSVQKFLF